MSKSIEAGICFTNCYRFISYAASFGGRKNSGYGRESGSDAIRDMQIKKQFGSQKQKLLKIHLKLGNYFLLFVSEAR